MDAPDTSPPSIVSVFPVDGAAMVGLVTPISVTFNERVQTVTVKPFIVTSGGVTFQGTMSFSPDTLIATFQPNLPFPPNSIISVVLLGNIWDAIGNQSPDNGRSWSFTTGSSPDTTAPVISNVASGTVTQTSVVITWTTDEDSTSQVEYGLTTSYGSITTLDTTLTKTHSVSVTGLTALTTYHYRVKSKDALATKRKSTVFSD